MASKRAIIFILAWYGSVTSCFVLNHHPKHSMTYLSSTKSSSDSSSELRTRQSKQNNKKSKKTAKLPRNNESNNKRMRKSEIDDLVRGIGLQPVQSQSTKTTNRQQAKQRQATSINTEVTEHLSVLNDKTPHISLQQQLDYARNGHTVLPSFISHETIQQLKSEIIPYTHSHRLAAWKQKVEVQLASSSDDYYRENSQSIVDSIDTIESCQDMLESLGIERVDLPFLQYFNTWRATDSNTPTVRELCLSPYLAQAASILMDSPTVRLYQDSLFHKRAGDGWTPWHSDARMSPFDTSRMITFWIPLQNVPTPESGGTGLHFVNYSHSDFALPYWNGAEGKEYERLEERYGSKSIAHHMPLNVGDVTVHSGWTLHCADAADLMMEVKDRYAFSITFVDGNAELREDVLLADNQIDTDGSKGDMEDLWSYRSWVKEIEPRSNFRHAAVPIVWPLKERDE